MIVLHGIGRCRCKCGVSHIRVNRAEQRVLGRTSFCRRCKQQLCTKKRCHRTTGGKQHAHAPRLGGRAKVLSLGPRRAPSAFTLAVVGARSELFFTMKTIHVYAANGLLDPPTHQSAPGPRPPPRCPRDRYPPSPSGEAIRHHPYGQPS